MSLPLENWGQLQLSSDKDGGTEGSLQVLQLLSLPKGKAKDNASYVPRPIFSLPISHIASASGTTKNDVSLTMRPNAVTGRDDGAEMELTSIRFAVPNVCVGYDQTEEAGRVILQEIQEGMAKHQEQFLKAHHNGTQDGKLLMLATMGTGQAPQKDERLVATFDDVSLSYPSGKYKIVVSNYSVVLEDKRKGTSGGLFSFPLSDIQNLFLCDVPLYFSATEDLDFSTAPQYVVLILKNPIKIRATVYKHLVISCPAGLSLDATHPWKCELSSQDEINKVLGLPPAKEGEEPALVPTMSGRVSDILTRVFKAIAKVPAYAGVNKEYRSLLTGRQQSCMRCLFHAAEGLLYIVNSGFLYLHRPATRILFTDILRVEMDESESGQATFQITVYAKAARGEEKYIFSGIAKEEKEGLLGYLATKVKVIRSGIGADDEDDEEDEEDDDDSDADAEEEEDDDDSDSDGDGDGSDEDGEANASHKRRRKEKKEKKHKKHKRDKKHKKHKKEKKHSED